MWFNINRSWLFWRMLLANKIINVVRWIEIHSSCISLLSKRYTGTDRVEMRNRFSIGQQLLAMLKYLIFTTLLMKMVQQKTTREPESFDRFLLHWCILFTKETCFWRLRVATFIYSHCIIPPHRRGETIRGTTYLAESSGGRLASPPWISASWQFFVTFLG